MCKYIILLSFFSMLLLTGYTLRSQQTPYFETTIYFEDAVGNRDSVIFGFDPNATYGLDPEFGEIELTTPFDSIFEVRIGSGYFSNIDYLSKRIIEKAVFESWCSGEFRSNSGGYICIYAIHQPVKVSWDRDTMLYSVSGCNRGSWITNNNLFQVAGPFEPWEIPPLYYCMASDSFGIYNFLTDTIPPGNKITTEREVTGSGTIEIPALLLTLDATFYFTPCYWVTDLIEEYGSDITNINVFPNPSSDHITIQLPENEWIEKVIVFNTNGELVRSGHLEDYRLEVCELVPGVYKILVVSNTGGLYSSTFLRM